MTTSDETWDDDAEEIMIEVSDELGAFVSIHFDSRELDALQAAVERAGTSATAFIKAAALDHIARTNLFSEITPWIASDSPFSVYPEWLAVASGSMAYLSGVSGIESNDNPGNWPTPFTGGTGRLFTPVGDLDSAEQEQQIMRTAEPGS